MIARYFLSFVSDMVCAFSSVRLSACSSQPIDANTNFSCANEFVYRAKVKLLSTFSCLLIDTSKDEEGRENSRQLYKPKT